MFSEHSQYQPAPTDPLEDTTEPLSHDGDTSGKVYLRKGRNAGQAEEEGITRSGEWEVLDGRAGTSLERLWPMEDQRWSRGKELRRKDR